MGLEDDEIEAAVRVCSSIGSCTIVEVIVDGSEGEGGRG